jgi:hypothetical protein
MRPNITPFIFLICLSLSSCLPSQKNEKDGGKIKLDTVAVNAEYSMGVATDMIKTTTLNEAASLQYQNIFKETYIIVIDEDKKEFIEAYEDLDNYDSTRSVISNYADTQVQLTTSHLDVINKKEISSLKINGLDATTTEIDANVEGVNSPITYFLTFVEGKEKLYMIMAWTFQEKKNDHRAAFMQMAKSFKTL